MTSNKQAKCMTLTMDAHAKTITSRVKRMVIDFSRIGIRPGAHPSVELNPLPV